MADKIICNKSDLVNIADAIRTKLGVTDTYYVSDLGSTVSNELTKKLPILSNPGSASDLISGKELIDQDGNVVTGTIPTKTSSDLTSSGATVTVTAGYYASSASKSVSTATQATPTISVDSSGLITASSTQSEGYVSSGTKSATKQLTTKAAATITPSTSDQTIASGTYLTGAQTIKGDANLVAGNIKSGASIFGVAGSYTPNLQSKSVTYTSNETVTVTPDANYDGLSQVTVEAMPTTTQATPSISVSSSGLITASATQSAGYVSSGTKSSTKQLTTQAAKTVTPSTSNQTAVASGRYTTGAVTVKGDANLVADNIKSGTSIFGVTGSYQDSTPIEISTDAGMEAVLTSENVGKVYKFTGTSDTYTNGDLYIVEVG